MRRGVWCASGLALVLAIALGGRGVDAATPPPPFPEDGLVVSGVGDAYDDLREFLRVFESRVGAQYHVAIVDLSDRLARRGAEYGDYDHTYIEAVIERWRPHLDMATHVSIVLAIGNREVLIQAGSRWVRLGYAGLETSRVTDASPFGDLARAGDYGEATVQLVRYIDGYLDDRVTHAQQVEASSRQLIGFVAERLERIAWRWEGDQGFDTSESRRIYELAQVRLDEAREFLERGRAERAGELAQQASSLIYNAIDVQADERHQHYLRTQVYPVVGGIVAGSVLMMLLLVFWFRRRSQKRLAESQLADWEHKLALAGQRLLALEQEHALIIGRRDPVEYFRGQSAESVRTAASNLDTLFMYYEAAQGIAARARRDIEAAGWLRGRASFDRARARLNEERLVITTGDVQERRLFLPTEREVILSAEELLDGMDATYSEVSTQLATLEERFGRVWESAESAVSQAVEAERLIEELRDRGLDPNALDEPRQALASSLEEAAEASHRDPLAASSELTVLVDELAQLLDRLRRVRDAISAAADLDPELQRVTRRLAELRQSASPIQLLEPGFEPDEMLSHATDAVDECWAAAAEGEDVAAAAASAEAVETVADVDDLITQSVASREQTPERIAALGSRVEALQTGVPQHAEDLATLESIHAAAALQPALDNISQAEAEIKAAVGCLNEATIAVQPDEQRYLAGAELTRRAGRLLDAVDELFAEIDHKAEQLAAARQAAEASLAAIDADLELLNALLAGQPAHATQDTLDDHAELVAERAGLGAQIEHRRPNWLALNESADLAARLSTSLVERAKADREAHAVCLELLPKAEAKAEGLDALLRSSLDDRPPANGALETGRELLARVVELTRVERPDWTAVRTVLEQAETQLDEAKRLAEIDFTEAAAARNALHQAETAIRDVNQTYGHGVTANLGSTQGALKQARNHLSAFDYALAAEQARRAVRLAVDARIDARERALQEGRKRRAAAARSRRSSSSSRSWSRPSRSSTRRSSSFGSSSGRSSFRRSSSRSSFGRSSGRSKW